MSFLSTHSNASVRDIEWFISMSCGEIRPWDNSIRHLLKNIGPSKPELWSLSLEMSLRLYTKINLNSLILIETITFKKTTAPTNPLVRALHAPEQESVTRTPIMRLFTPKRAFYPRLYRIYFLRKKCLFRCIRRAGCLHKTSNDSERGVGALYRGSHFFELIVPRANWGVRSVSGVAKVEWWGWCSIKLSRRPNTNVGD